MWTTGVQGFDTLPGLNIAFFWPHQNCYLRWGNRKISRMNRWFFRIIWLKVVGNNVGMSENWDKLNTPTPCFSSVSFETQPVVGYLDVHPKFISGSVGMNNTCRIIYIYIDRYINKLGTYSKNTIIHTILQYIYTMPMAPQLHLLLRKTWVMRGSLRRFVNMRLLRLGQLYDFGFGFSWGKLGGKSGGNLWKLGTEKIIWWGHFGCWEREFYPQISSPWCWNINTYKTGWFLGQMLVIT